MAKNGKKRSPLTLFDYLCNRLIIRNLEMVRGTGFEPVAPTVSR